MKHLYEKRGWFYFQAPTPKGGTRPKAIALRTKDYVAAVVEATRLGDNLALASTLRRHTMDEVLPKYYREKSEDAKSTRASRELVLQKFSEFAGNPLVSEITKETIQDWRDNLRKVGGGQSGKGVSESAVMSYTIILRAFLNWAMRHHYLRTDPMAGMKRQTKVRKTRRSDFLTEDEREILLAAPAKDELRFVLHMGFFAGLRDGEIQAMTPNWIWVANDWQSGSITVQDTWVKRKDGTTFLWRPKGRKLRTIPMHPRLLAFLKDYKIREPFMLAPEKEFWPDEEKHSRRFECRNAMKGLVKRTSVRKLNYHILRHSFATHLVSKGVSLAQVAHLLGDTLKVTEENYAGFSPTRTNPLEVL